MSMQEKRLTGVKIKIKKGQPIGAWERVKLGDKSVVKGKQYFLANKWHISKHKCPSCSSKKTFHKERVKTLEPTLRETGAIYSNTMKNDLRNEGNTRIVQKWDLCLNCGWQWIFEMFCWQKTEKDAKGRLQKLDRIVFVD